MEKSDPELRRLLFHAAMQGRATRYGNPAAWVTRPWIRHKRGTRCTGQKACEDLLCRKTTPISARITPGGVCCNPESIHQEIVVTDMLC